MSDQSLIDKIEKRLNYLLVEKGEGKITDMHVLAMDLVHCINCPSEIRDDKDEIIQLQRQRIESLEQSIGIANDDYYNDLYEDGDCGLWHHPLMANLMAVLARDGYTPMSRGTQICLVKAALRSTREPVSVLPKQEPLGADFQKVLDDNFSDLLVKDWNDIGKTISEQPVGITDDNHEFEDWWDKEGKFLDPDTDDVPWFDKRKELCAYAFYYGKKLGQKEGLSFPKRESGWLPIERQQLAEECAKYFAGYSFSRHEAAQCLKLIDVLISKKLIAKPPTTEIEVEPTEGK